MNLRHTAACQMARGHEGTLGGLTIGYHATAPTASPALSTPRLPEVVSAPVARRLVEAELTIQRRWRRTHLLLRVLWHRSSPLISLTRSTRGPFVWLRTTFERGS